MPQQTNFYDCGLYPGHFLSVFLSAPEAYTTHCTVLKLSHMPATYVLNVSFQGKVLIEGSLDVVWRHERIKVARGWLKSLVLASTEIRQAALDFNTDIPSPFAI